MKLDYDHARTVLASAVAVARGGKGLPVEWRGHGTTVFGLESKTYAAALVTLLLAKSVNAEVDTMAIKITDDGRSYSLRGLGHSVVVPGAVTHGFTLRVTGREPLNNQPWFRYNRIDEFERVKHRSDYEYFLGVARRANSLSEEEARGALAAVLYVALDHAARIRAVAVKADGLTTRDARIAAEDFLRADAADRPQRLQAFAAACLDLGHTEVLSRRINDPSRDVPGDVRAIADDSLILSMEVRGKAVPATELGAFADACGSAGIGRAMLFVDFPAHRRIVREEVESHAVRAGVVHLSVFESVGELLDAAVAWTDVPLATATERFATRMLYRLREIEVSKSTLDEWVLER
ncbi:MAG: restriction endonuclease, SacI family [Schumannella sp.]